MIEQILNWIKKPESQRMVLSIVLAFVLLLFYRSCSNHADEVALNRQNLAAMFDSTRILSNKVGELEAVRTVLVTEQSDLKDLNKGLASELEKERGKSKLIIQTNTVFRTDTIRVNDVLIKYRDGEYGIKWDYADTLGTQELAGETKFAVDSIGTVSSRGTELTKNLFMLKLFVGLRENDQGLYEIWARSNDPRVMIPEIDGAVLDPAMLFPKKHPWGLGIQVGIGAGANISGNSVVEMFAGPYVGIGVSYNIFNF